MFKNYFESINGIDIYPVFALLMFFVFFLLVIAWLFKIDKNYLSEMEKLPVEFKSENNE